MNKHSLRVLEFDKVVSIVAEFAASEPGKAVVRRRLPEAERETVLVRLKETNEFMRILQRGENPPLDGIPDTRQAIEKLEVLGSMLAPVELLNVAVTLAIGRRLKKYIERLNGKSDPMLGHESPLLLMRAVAIHAHKDLEDAVFAALDERAEVKDSASPELRKIRKFITRTRDEILNLMSGILQDPGFQKVIQEPVITIRDDRYVLPLKPNFRQNLKGVVHGRSASKATLFVEPFGILEQNNRLAKLRMEESLEVDRILRALTALLSRERKTIRATAEALAEIDAIYARARFGITIDGIVPELAAGRQIRLRGARHPLLVWQRRTVNADNVTPNDLEMNEHQRALILSGPNAGGKTVILKMVGLLCLMAQAGLPVTAAEGSELPCFGSVFADIGDEQSLEQDLSTFSSHVGNIADILRDADADSLVLLDELGAGTDPGEGAGLGAAVLESLIERGALTLVTTHHNALKLFGVQTRGALNYAMEFDPLTLKPTYRLISGRPGRSYGLDMAARIGIPAGIIEKARDRIGEDDVRLENLLKQVELDAQQLAAEREALSRELLAVHQERIETGAALDAARSEAQELITKARAETREVVASLRRKLHELSQTQTIEQAALKKSSADVDSFIRKLNADRQDRHSMSPGVTTKLHPGDRVQIPRWNRAATVLASRRGSLEIDVEGKKVTLSERDVLRVEPALGQQNTHAVPGWSAQIHEHEGSSDRLNIVGFRVDEGLAEVERFIDGASVSGQSIVTIIHGLGTGALKSAVTGYLKNHPLVAAIRSGEPAEGGAGVTIAELKK